MKILRDHGSQINKVDQRSPKIQRKTAASRVRKVGKDKIELSPRAREVRRLVELAKLAPEVRLEKINAIKKQIQAGKYSVPPESIARSIIDLHKKLKSDDE